ncbi:Lin1244/Lin1753 domain-containing protein [Enterococcus alishanensis]
MARPTKSGLDYFPLDVHIFEDEKIEAIAGEFGIKGELAVIKLLCAVYEKGYFVVWNDLTKAKLLKRLPGTSKDLLEQVVNRLVTWGFFNESLFNSAKVLTSETIQATYFEATKRRKSQKPTQYVINDNINTQTTGVNDDINAQSKVNKSKVNKSKYVSDNSVDHISRNKAAEYWLNQVNPDEAPVILKSIDYWEKDFNNAEIVIMAIDEMLKNEARSYNYLNKVLKSWESKKLDTTEKVRKHLDGHFSKGNFNKTNNSQWTNKNLWDYWWAERMAGNPSVKSLARKKSFTDEEQMRLIKIINDKGYGDEIS